MESSTVTPFLSNLAFPEGSRWHEGRLWFSDMKGKFVFSVSAEGNDLRQEANVPAWPSGLGWLPDGRLLVVAMRDKALLRRETDGSLTRVADLSPWFDHWANDSVVDAQGRCYIGTPGTNKQMVRVDPDGSVTPVGDPLDGPNGCVITPDGKTLIVVAKDILHAFAIAPDGSLSGRRVFAQHPAEVGFDGICLDSEGAVWASLPRGEGVVRIKEGGEITDTVTLPGRFVVDCSLGGPDLRTLYICSAVVEEVTNPLKNPIGFIDTITVDVPGV
jgi:sugar lactone lactonase YvrE